jgi:hypothetical protein
MSEKIDGLIANLRTANQWSSTILSGDILSWLIAELNSADPKRVAAAITRAETIIAEYRADYAKDHSL